ncbi:carbohydrate ABC transporter permease [Pseudonocardia acaciae]|uniref:carbohydrate ABC transporter permease n=1 Tax=Pseudonocardia acaciae TaxID=551276 RepID=UPI0009FD51D6|nr:sugar ABC transporter permease [Pseudonocardia acaciae]
MVVPALAFFVLFAAAPLLIVGVLSLTEWDGLGAPTLAGLVNWREIAADPVVRGAVWLSVKVTILSWLVQTPLSLLLGVFIAGRQRYRAVFAVLYFVPLLLSTAAIAITWKDLLDPNFGLGSAPGLGWISGDWLGDQDTALYAVVLVIAWQFVPFHTLLYQAGTRQIPAALYEAAEIDGAGRLNQFWHITLPQLRYTIVTSSTLILVGSLTYFDLVFVMTGGGPGFATRILPLDMYITGFTTGDMGKASATAMVLVLAGLLLALGVVRYSGFGRMRSQQEGM